MQELFEQRTDITDNELLTALAIGMHANNASSSPRSAWPGIKRLAQLTRKSPRSVYRAITKLRRKGILQVHKGGAAAHGLNGDLYVFPPMELCVTDDKIVTGGKSVTGGKIVTDDKIVTGDMKSASPVTHKPEYRTKTLPGQGEDKEGMELPLLLRARALFRIRPTSKLDAAQEKAWRKAAPLVADTLPGEWQQLEAYYAAEIPRRDDIRRRDLATLLNNWSGELTRARDWCAKVGWTPPTPAATVPEDWRRLLDIVIERDYGQQLAAEDPEGYEKWKAFNDQCYSMWSGVPDWLQREIRELASKESQAPEPDGWQAALDVMLEAGELETDAAFEAWDDLPLWRRLQIRTILASASETHDTHGTLHDPARASN